MTPHDQGGTAEELWCGSCQQFCYPLAEDTPNNLCACCEDRDRGSAVTRPTPVEGTFYRGLAAGAMLSWPIWLLLYLIWRWTA